MTFGAARGRFGPRYFKAFQCAAIEEHLARVDEEEVAARLAVREEEGARRGVGGGLDDEASGEASPRVAAAAALAHAAISPDLVAVGGAGGDDDDAALDAPGPGSWSHAVVGHDEGEKPVLAPLELAEALTGDGRGLMLQDAPADPAPLFEGWLQKRGLIRRTFQKRWVVVASGVDNYALSYFAKKEHAEHEDLRKGVIHLCGYRVKRVKSESEVRAHGNFAIALRPRDPRRRTWIFRCASEKERGRWKEALRFASEHSRAPHALDSVMRRAFVDAYTQVREAIGLPKSTGFERGEEEELVALAFEYIEDQGVVTYAADRQRESGELSRGAKSAAKAARNQRKSVAVPGHLSSAVAGGGAEGDSDSDPEADRDLMAQVEDKIREVVNMHWRRYVGGLSASKPATEARCAEHAQETRRVRREVIEHIRGPIYETTTQDAHDVMSPIMVPLIGALLPAVFGSVEQVVSLLSERFVSWTVGIGPEAARRKERLRRFNQHKLDDFAADCRRYSGLLKPAYEQIRETTRNDRGFMDISPAIVAIARLSNAARKGHELSHSGRELIRGSRDLAAAGEAYGVPPDVVLQAETAGMLYSDRQVPMDHFIDMLQGRSLWDVERRLEASVLQLTRNAVHTLKQACDLALVDEGDGSIDSVRDITAAIMAALAHDAILHALGNLRSILFAVVFPPFRNEQVHKIFAAMDETLRMVPGHISGFLDMDAVRDEVLGEVVYKEIDKLLRASCGPSIERIQRVLRDALKDLSGSEPADS